MPATAKKRKRGGLSKWKPINLVLIYRLAKAGLSEEAIASSLKVSRFTFRESWCKTYPEVREVLDLVKKETLEEDSLADYLFGKLPSNLQDLWKKIHKFDKERNGVVKIEMLLSDHGKCVRQQLFLHALATSSFNATKACQKVAVTKYELDKWINEDIEFAELVEQVEWHKGNFFEEMLVNLVKDRNPAAVIAVNKQFNAGRGYGAKLEVDHRHSGAVMHGVIDLSDLMPYLADDIKLKLLDAIRAKEQAANKLKTLSPPRPDSDEAFSEQIVDMVEAESAALS